MSVSAFKKVGTLIGCRDLCFAAITAESSASTTYDTTIHTAPGVIEIALTAQVAEAQLGANDNPYYEIMQALDGFEVNVTQAALGSDLVAFLRGITVDANGAVIESSDDKAPYVAMGFKTRRSDGSDDYIWLYRGRFAPGDQTFKTKEKGTINWQTPTLKGVFGPRLNDRQIKAVLNSGDVAQGSTVLESFFSSVYAKAS